MTAGEGARASQVSVLVGPAGSGKTEHCLQKMRECERSDRPAMLLVPDQFTYAADRLLLDVAGLAGVRRVRVLSFHRFAHLLAAPAQSPSTLLSEEARRLLLRRIVNDLPLPELGPLAQVRATPGFVEALAILIRELKGIGGPHAAAALAASAGDNAKLRALALILRSYEEALHAAGLTDPSDWVHALADRLASDPGPWALHAAWIDGFVSFTPEEKALLLALARVAPELTITLCADPREARLAREEIADAALLGVAPTSSLVFEALRPKLERPQFLPALRTLVWLDQALAGRLLVTPLPPRSPRFAHPELLHLERELFRSRGAAAPGPRPDGAIRRRCFATAYHEVDGWARWIDARVRLGDGSARYRDVAILVRDLDAYRPLVREAFARYNIPVFIDQRRDATAHPLLRLCLSSLRMAAQGWTREAVASVLRNPLLGIAPEVVDRIENLAMEYGIEYERWYQTRWEVLPLPDRDAPIEIAPGQDDAENFSPEEPADPLEPEPDPASVLRDRRMERRRLAAAEARAVTARFFPILRRFTDTWRGVTPGFSTGAQALRDALAALAGGSGSSVGGALPTPHDRIGAWASALPEAIGAAWPVAESIQIARLLEETLAAGTRLLGTAPVGASLFTRLLKDAFSGAAIGLTPQALDAVTLAEPRRSRINEAPYVIFGGLVATAFPRPHTEDPLLSDREREEFAAQGFPLARTAANAEEESYLFYIACTRARRELMLTYPALNERGKPVEPSSYLAEVDRIIGPDAAPPQRPESEGGLAACQHPWQLGAALGSTLRSMTPDAAERLARRATELLPSAAEALSVVRLRAEKVRAPLPDRLPGEIPAALHAGGVLRTSASQLEAFARCPFQYFARHVLKLEPRPEGRLTPLSTGTAVHAALQRFFASPPADESEDAAARRMRRIFADLSREEEFRIFQEDPPSAYRWLVTGRDLQHFIRTEQRRLRTSCFLPCAVELVFGQPGIPPERSAALRRSVQRGECIGVVALPPLEIEIDPRSPELDSDVAPGPGQVWRVQVRGRIDRVDIARTPNAEPAALVIDYKHRPPQRAVRGELERGLNLQIAIYLLAARELLGVRPVGGIYYSVAPQPHAPEPVAPEANRFGFQMNGFIVDEAGDGIDPEHAFALRTLPADEVEPGEAIPRAVAEVRRKVIYLSAGILSGKIRPEPAASGKRLPCEQCDFRGICRFDVAAARERETGGGT